MTRLWSSIPPSSIVVRQAIASTLVMLVTIALIALTAYIAVERQQQAATLATIDTDIAGLVDGMAAGGVPQVKARIADRLAFDGGSGAGYRLADAQGKRLAGNLAAATLDPARSQSGTITAPGGPALARATRLRGGFVLTVARSLTPIRAVTGRLMALFALAAIPAALISLLAGALSARRFSRQIAGLNDVFGRFEAGERGARSGAERRRDEFGRLSGHVDRHLATTARLISTQRQISDNIAHELRTPLGHLDGRLLAMLARAPDAALEDELHRARDDIRSIVSLFDALLDLALAEATAAEGAGATVFDLSEQLANLVELYAPSAEEEGIEFTARISPGVTMRGEPLAMARAAANLLDNAFKFTGAGSHVRLTVTDGPRIVVEDDGPGVAPALRDCLFERFRGSHGGGQGHGLGLALVKVIALRHGLAARFEDSSPGARFILEPAAAAA